MTGNALTETTENKTAQMRAPDRNVLLEARALRKSYGSGDSP